MIGGEVQGGLTDGQRHRLGSFDHLSQVIGGTANHRREGWQARRQVRQTEDPAMDGNSDVELAHPGARPCKQLSQSVYDFLTSSDCVFGVRFTRTWIAKAGEHSAAS